MSATAPLPWEHQSGHTPGRAFRATLWELILRPRAFYGEMASDGGLHEPVTFFVLLLASVIVTGFGASLACAGAIAPADTLTPGQEFMVALPARSFGIGLALLPEVLVLAAAGMAAAGTLFHSAARLFGARHWEACVSIALYATSAALFPIVAALAIVFAVAGGGYFIALASADAATAVSNVVRLAAMIAPGIGVLAAIIILPAHCTVGLCRCFELDPVVAGAATACGTAQVIALPVAVWAIARFVDSRTAVFAAVVGLTAIVALTAWQAARPQRRRVDG